MTDWYHMTFDHMLHLSSIKTTDTIDFNLKYDHLAQKNEAKFEYVSSIKLRIRLN